MKNITLKTTEQTDAIIVKVAETLALLEAAPVSRADEQILISMDVDPTDITSIESLAASMKETLDCEVADFQIVPVIGTGTPGEAPDCSVGFCYRAPVPYRVSFAFNNGRRFEKEVGLPNGGPIIAVPLTRAAFVEKVTNVTFVDGTPSKIELTKPSETLEFVSIPVEVAKALVRVPTELVKLKVDLSDQERKLAEIEKARIEAERELEETRTEAALESSPLRVEKVLMFGSSGGWTGARVPQATTPAPRPQPREGDGHGELEPIGGAPGTG